MKRHYNKGVGAFASALLIILSSSQNMQAKPAYFIGWVNRTGHDLNDVALLFGGKQAAGPGILVKRGVATEGYVTLPLPSEAKVQWTEDGNPHSVVVKLPDFPARAKPHWTLYFSIGPADAVQAKAVRYDDLAARSEITKGLQPEGEYKFGFVNKTGQDLTDIAVNYGDQRVGSTRDVPARVRVNYSDPLTTPFTPEARVEWKENGMDRSVTVKLEGVVPKGFSDGNIFFVFRPGAKVEVRPIKASDSQASINLIREQ